MITLAKMSSLWQDHIHNKAFIFFRTFFLYRYLYTFSVYFSHLFLPTMTVRYKKKKAQLHLRNGNLWQHAASSCKTWPPNAEGVPHTWTALRHISGGVHENRPCHFEYFSHQIFCWSFEFSTGQRLQHNAPQRREKEIERDRARENQLAHTGARDLPPFRAVSDTKRERQHPPQKRSKSFAARSWAWAQARGMRQGQVRGPVEASPAETGGRRWARPSRGQICSCGCHCGGQAGNYRERFYVTRSSGSWGWGETATGSACCYSCWGQTSPLQRRKKNEFC